jgi:hypothetical protein
MPYIFGLPELNIIQTFGLSLLINMLTSKPPNSNVQDVDESLLGSQINKYYELRDELEKSFDK